MFHVIHACHPRPPSRSRVNFASSFSTFNRLVPIMLGSSRSGRGLQPLHFLSEHPIIPTSYSLSRSTATLMDFPASVANKRLTARLNSLDATLHLQETRGEVVPDSGAHHSLLNSNPFLSHSYALFCAAKKSTHLFSSDSALSTAKHSGWGYPYPWGLCLSIGRSLRTRRSRPCRNWLGISANAFAFNCRLSTYSGRGRGALLTDRLLARGGGTHGFVHIGVCLLAGIAPALVAALEVFKVILQNFFASLAHAFSGGFIQCALCLLLGSSIRVLPELHDRSVGAPVALVLRVAVSLHLLVQRVNQQVVSPQDERNPRDTQNQEPFKHSTEPTPSLRFIVAEYSVAQAPRRRNGVHQYLHRAGTHGPQAGRWVARAGNCLTIYWTLYQFYAAEPSCNLMLSQSEVRL